MFLDRDRIDMVYPYLYHELSREILREPFHGTQMGKIYKKCIFNLKVRIFLIVTLWKLVFSFLYSFSSGLILAINRPKSTFLCFVFNFDFFFLHKKVHGRRYFG